jgi:hypothetical protein
MSTTFGIKIPSTGKEVKIARRVGIGNSKVKVFFINDIAELLPDDLEVIALDNSNQGIFTIKDIKDLIKLKQR